MLRRIAQERVPTASNVGLRDVTWASPAYTSHPLSRLSFRVFRGPHSLGKAGTLTGPWGLRVLCAKNKPAVRTLTAICNALS